MAKAASAAAPRTPKTAEPAPTTAEPAADPADASAPSSPPAAVPSLLAPDELCAFAASSSSAERLALLAASLGVAHYEANPRSLVWVNFCFGVLTFALEEAQLSDAKTLALLRAANDVFTFATTQQSGDNDAIADPERPRGFPSTQATYDAFRQVVRAASVAAVSAEAAEPLWEPSDVARIVAFMSSTFFRHLAAYQHVFQFPRERLEREVALIVESPLPPPPLALARGDE